MKNNPNEMLRTMVMDKVETSKEGKEEKTASVKKSSKPARAKKPLEKNDAILDARAHTAQEKYTGVFDLSLKEVYIMDGAKRKKRGTKVSTTPTSVFLQEDEKEYLIALSEKYGVSISGLIRTLIVNAK